MKFMVIVKDTKRTDLIVMEDNAVINVDKISYRAWHKYLMNSVEELKSDILTCHEGIESLDAIYLLGEYYSKLYTYLEVIDSIDKRGKRKYSYFHITFEDGTQNVRHKLKSIIKKEKANISNSLTYR